MGGKGTLIALREADDVRNGLSPLNSRPDTDMESLDGLRLIVERWTLSVER